MITKKRYFLFFYLAVVLSEKSFSYTKHYYECPLKVICQTLVDHYRLDPNKSLIFNDYKSENVRYVETKKDRRLTGTLSVLNNFTYQKGNNVITLYDGIGITGDESTTNWQTNFNLNLQYDLLRLSDKLAPIENTLMGEKIKVRKMIFRDLLQIFPRFSIEESNNSRRGLFFYLNRLDVIKGTTAFVDTLKKDYKKMIGLYKNKAITLNDLRQANKLVSRASEALFRAQGRLSWMYPDEYRLKKKLDIIKAIVEKNEDLIISENLEEKSDKIKVCGLLEFIEREEGLELGKLKLNFDQTNDRLSYTFPQGLMLQMMSSLDNPAQMTGMVGFGVNYRLFDSTENYIARIMYRENKKDISQIYSDQKVSEFERIQIESQSFFQAKEHLLTMKFNYQQSKIFNKGFFRGNIFKNNLRVRNEGILARNELIEEHLREELDYKYAKTHFMSNIFRIKAICPIVDETVKDLD
tara:strand:+ start:5274 stop:6671 length:1398 start_codon:yes stop_codon:yes gene_type:complete